MSRKLFGTVAALLSGSLLLAACTPSTGETGAGIGLPAQLSADAPEGFQSYYRQKVDFAPCEADQVTMDRMAAPSDLKNYHCATVQAPLNWDDPDSEPIELALAVYQKNKDQDQPLLFFNLGGPGGDAVRSLSAFAELIVPQEVADAFTLVATDPRGVGESTPVTCWTDQERDEEFSDPDDPRDGSLEETVEESRKELAELYAQCKERSGDIVDFVDTDSVARDFDMLRALFGQEELDYLGYSYGTLLGAVYAELFPEKVGRFVLDGAMDPAVDVNQLSALQAGGMEEALYHWIETCQEGKSCPISGDLESGKKQIKEFLEDLEENPLDTGEADRPLTTSLARTGIIGSLYSPESYPLLETGMQMAQSGDGSVLLLLADFYNGREDDGTFDNSQDAFIAVSALDYEPVGTPEEWEKQAEEIAKENPVLGGEFGFASAGLDAWGATSRRPRAAVTAEGAAPIVVVGTTHDPATPYVMAESMAESLSSAVLVTYDGWGHGAYQVGGNECLLDVVNNYLVDGVVPPEGTVCGQ